ncbi:putative membrane protein [Weissella oryzae SG25]|uniref:Putative membrane protein n=1 Tax=Weissella oryzae (strain DSM 25784 / JCM 18191 / LMG 30913 / SG25) TaxID=1329250 RepID=A0A069CWD7_WEIOS|nr:hypothetical protein [Weissella oryzae]GAK31543.1 putative membrane protein [Weissella oryzae SG25]
MGQSLKNKKYILLSFLSILILGLSVVYYCSASADYVTQQETSQKEQSDLKKQLTTNKNMKETLNSTKITSFEDLKNAKSNDEMQKNKYWQDPSVYQDIVNQFFNQSFNDMEKQSTTSNTGHLKYGTENCYETLVATFNGVGGFSNKLGDYDLTLKHTNGSAKTVLFGDIKVNQRQISSGQEGTSEQNTEATSAVVDKTVYMVIDYDDKHNLVITSLQLGDIQEAKADENI